MSNEFRKAVMTGAATDKAGGNPLVQTKRAQGANGDNLGSVTIARNESRAADHRDGDRHRLRNEQVAVHWKDTGFDAELINLSGGGGMISAPFSPKLWDRVDLVLGDGAPIECAVRWLRGGRIGLEFAHETRIEGDPALRDQTLLSVIRRTFEAVEVASPASVPEPTPAANDYDASRRIERRHPLIWLGEIHYSHESTPVRLRNISMSGALVDCPRSFDDGAEVMLDLGSGVTHFAQISWVRSGQAGLTFTAPFDLARLAEARPPEVTPTQWVRPGFLDTKSDSSPWDEKWDRPTIDQLRDDLEGFLKY